MERIGCGRTAEVFDYGDGKILKLFFPEYPKLYAELEYRNAKTLFDLGVRVCQPFEMKDFDGRVGIVYERITGPSLLEQLQTNIHVETQADAAGLLAQVHQSLLSHHSDELIDYRDFLATVIGEENEKNSALLQEIRALPAGNCVMHGDYHPGNLLLDENGAPVLVDFLNVCRGDARYDIARTYFLLHHSAPGFAELYLSKMGTRFEEIESFYDLICRYRKFENPEE